MPNGRTFAIGDIVVNRRGGSPGVIVGREPNRGPIVYALPNGPQTIWQAENMRSVIDREDLVELARQAIAAASDS